MDTHSEELARLIRLLDIDVSRAIALTMGGIGLSYHSEMRPEDFLEQAERDYETGGISAKLNAITNAKRAIRCQIDAVLQCFGFDLRVRIGEKLTIIREIGFVAPRVLQRVDRARNLLEHEYKAPSTEQIDEAMDLAALFVEACGRNLHTFEGEFSIGNEDDWITPQCYFRSELSLGFQGQQKNFHVIAWKGKAGPYEMRGEAVIGETDISPADVAFPYLIRTAIFASKARESKTKEAIQQLFSVIGLLSSVAVKK